MKSGVWLPTIGVPADAQRVQVSTLSAGSVTNPFVLVSKPRELAFLLDVLRSCTKHGKITKDALRQSVILTRVADLTQQALGGYSLDSICRDNSFKLTAVYSTSKPISTR